MLVVWGGLAVVGLSAAVLSFSALADLAYRCGFTRVLLGDKNGAGGFHLAWLLPLTIDAFAITATVIWLRRRVSAEAIRFAQQSAWSAIIATVVGNGYHGYLIDGDKVPPLPVLIIVSAVPAVALGALVHLAVLVGREMDDEPDRPAVDPWAALHDDALAEPWARAIREWLERAPTAPTAPVDESDRPVPSRDEPNEVLAADLAFVDADRQSRGLPVLSRDGIMRRYGVGAPRAGKLRDLVVALAQSETGRDDTGDQVDEQLDEPGGGGGELLTHSGTVNGREWSA